MCQESKSGKRECADCFGVASQSKSYLHFVSWASRPRVVVNVSIIPNVTVVLILVLK